MDKQDPVYTSMNKVKIEAITQKIQILSFLLDFDYGHSNDKSTESTDTKVKMGLFTPPPRDNLLITALSAEETGELLRKV